MVLTSMGAPIRPQARVVDLEQLALSLLKKVKTQMLIIDELHNILAGGSHVRRALLNLLKFLGNELKIPIVGVGTREAYLAIRTDGQLENRFEPLPLPTWEEGDELLTLLASFAAALPLRQPSEIATLEMSRYIVAKTEGTIGEITRLLTSAAIEAINKGEERINQRTRNLRITNRRASDVEHLSGAEMTTRWPACPQMIAGERLSSWVGRIALFYRMKANDLLRYDLGFSQLRIGQLDMSAPSELIKKISSRTGVSEAGIEKGTFAGALPFLFRPYSERTNVGNRSVLWKQPRGNRFSSIKWFQKEAQAKFRACRLCFVDYPGTRLLSWGLKIISSCPIHKVMLEQVNIEQGLPRWSMETTEAASPVVSSLDMRSSIALTHGYVKLPGGLVPAERWFRLLVTILEELDTFPWENERWPWQKKMWEAADYCPTMPLQLLALNRKSNLLIALAVDQMERCYMTPTGQEAYLFL